EGLFDSGADGKALLLEQLVELFLAALTDKYSTETTPPGRPELFAAPPHLDAVAQREQVAEGAAAYARYIAEGAAAYAKYIQSHQSTTNPYLLGSTAWHNWEWGWGRAREEWTPGE